MVKQKKTNNLNKINHQKLKVEVKQDNKDNIFLFQISF